MQLMQYVENATSHDATGAITFNDDRPTVQLGGVGEFTDEEVARLSGMGMVLQQVDDGGLSDMTVEDLKKRAKKEDVELDKDDGKDDIVSKLRVALANSGERQAAMAIGGTGIAASGGPTGTPVGGGPAGTGTATGGGGPAT
jgi:hypothetical protein